MPDTEIEKGPCDSVIEPEMNGDLYLIPLPKTGCHLAIYRRELMMNLPDDLIIKCLERGKAIRRRKAFEERESLRHG